MSDIEGAICDECGYKVPPWGCCRTSHARIQEIDWLRDLNEKLLEALTLALLDHQRIDPHHSEDCDLCAVMKTALATAEAGPQLGPSQTRP